MEKLANGRILYGVDPPAAYIVINRPEKRNAMTYEMWRALATAYKEACSDENVRVVVLRGKGGALSAGDDIKEMSELKGTIDARRFFDALEEAFKAVMECPKITVAVVDGPAVGGGGEILLAMDYVIATRNAYTGFPEIHIGLIPPVLLTLGVFMLGLKNVKKLALTGRFLKAEEAHSLGIFDEIVDEDRIDESLKKIIDTSLILPEEAVKSIKRLILASIKPAYEYGMSELVQLVTTEEAKMRMMMFLEKKLPRPS